MKEAKVYVYRSVNFDGHVYVKVVGAPAGQACHVTLYQDTREVASASGAAAVFKGRREGCYRAVARLTARDGQTTALESREIQARYFPLLPDAPAAATTQVVQGVSRRYDGVTEYYLQIKFHTEHGLGRLMAGGTTRLPLFHRVTDQAVVTRIVSNPLLGDLLAATYRIDPHCTFDEMVNIATELERLDEVVYCCVMPDTTGLPAPELPALEPGFQAPAVEKQSLDATTPIFWPLQTYLWPSDNTTKGMNVTAAWVSGEVGNAATVRHLDFGVYRNHEDLKENMTVVHSRAETEDCNHGTASAGCIVAGNNSVGVMGIAHGCDFYFYDTGDLPLILRDAMPGDIVSLDIQFTSGGSRLPAIDSRGWWDQIHALTQQGVVVIMAAANGGLDLSVEAGHMNQFGDSGGILIGSCSHRSGRKHGSSNYNHPTSWINSWGDSSVVTTGYGSLQRTPGTDRNYSRDYSGTSSATPLCAGALALIQSHSIETYGIYLNAFGLRTLIQMTGEAEGVAEKIGHRPNVFAAMSMLATWFGPP
ncbi:S8 family serine peptidase [Pseudomonas sp. dw_358]|uniref:S8 family serine peptidase n=1 Tax=Pseudomonas sp. dw_358 TaxID=2720083 RepID=UPI001BD46F44|nr:S8 family serine peptidase [Pseudomonas sp. dw_358]